jgi:YaiO family outer membrane protein
LRQALMLVVLITAAFAQNDSTPLPQGAGITGLSGLPGSLSGPGYLEIGGGQSQLTRPNPSWVDLYIRGMLAKGRTLFNGEVMRQSRYDDVGYYYNAGIVRSLGERVYVDATVGSSVGGFFLPKLRADGHMHIKLLPNKRFVASLGAGYDKSKSVNSASRYEVSGTYYFEHPWILQGGTTVTRANPGNVFANASYAAVTQGREKEHYITFRAEIGREAYQIIGPASAIFNYEVHNYSLVWRQWVGTNWGLNFVAERQQNQYYRRNGATIGIFMDF